MIIGQAVTEINYTRRETHYRISQIVFPDEINGDGMVDIRHMIKDSPFQMNKHSLGFPR